MKILIKKKIKRYNKEKFNNLDRLLVSSPMEVILMLDKKASE